MVVVGVTLIEEDQVWVTVGDVDTVIMVHGSWC